MWRVTATATSTTTVEILNVLVVCGVLLTPDIILCSYNIVTVENNVVFCFITVENNVVFCFITVENIVLQILANTSI